MSYLAKQVPMEIESNISLGGTIILLALFAQRYIFGQNKIIYWHYHISFMFRDIQLIIKVLFVT